MGLTNRWSTSPVGELSTGTRRMVEITCMLALEPKVLLLDEPAGGIAQSEGEALVQLLTRRAPRPRHHARRSSSTTCRCCSGSPTACIAMELGRVIAKATPESVQEPPRRGAVLPRRRRRRGRAFGPVHGRFVVAFGDAPDHP
jgi:ABC-type branched-subunit amino acid transport system ATPase component